MTREEIQAAHRASTLGHCDRLYHLEAGRLVSGTAVHPDQTTGMSGEVFARVPGD